MVSNPACRRASSRAPNQPAKASNWSSREVERRGASNNGLGTLRCPGGEGASRGDVGSEPLKGRHRRLAFELSVLGTSRCSIRPGQEESRGGGFVGELHFLPELARTAEGWEGFVGVAVGELNRSARLSRARLERRGSVSSRDRRQFRGGRARQVELPGREGDLHARGQEPCPLQRPLRPVGDGTI